MIRSKPSATMQKTYDEAYLMCSTAVYFESQDNEAEALRSWRSALDAIYYHNAYKLPSGWRARSSTEKALHDSLRQLELRCKERVDLLTALRQSRDDAVTSPTPQIFVQEREAPPVPPRESMGKDGTNDGKVRGWLGGGTVAPVDQNSLPRPPQLPVRPSVASRGSSGRLDQQSNPNASKVNLSPDAIPTQRRGSRTPSPEKKGMLRTLRSGAAKRTTSATSARRTDMRPPAAAKAASQAWTTTSFATSDITLVNSNGRSSGQDDGYAKRSSDDEKLYGRTSLDRSDRPIGGLKHRASEGSVRSVSSDDRRQEDVSMAKVSTLTSSLPPVRMPSYRPEYAAPLPSRYTKPPLAAPPRQWDQRATSAPVPRSPTSPQSNRVPRKALGVVAAMQSRQRMDENQEASEAAHSLEPTLAPAGRGRPVVPDKPPTLNGNAMPDAQLPTQQSSNPTDEQKWAERKAHVLSHLPSNIDPTSAAQILNEVVVRSDPVTWNDISGLSVAKLTLKENIIYPFLRPDLFRGLREPARGILLFGPPGTGKTMLARAVATESRSTFFSIGAASLTSKFLGESEKLVRALFAVARLCGPSIVFVDEIESLLGQRGREGGHDALERVKTEFLTSWSELQRAAAGAISSDAGPGEDGGDASRVLVLAATNLPWLIDEAARRRFVRRQYIPLPEAETRRAQLQKLLERQRCELRSGQLDDLVRLTDGFSGSDITSLAKDAAMGPLRALGERLLDTTPEDIRPIQMQDFAASLVNIRPSVSSAGLKEFEDWAAEFGERGG